MNIRFLPFGLLLVAAVGCTPNQQTDSTANVDENLTTADINAIDMNAMNATDMNAIATWNATDTSMNASASDNDVVAPPPPTKGRPR